MGRIRKEIGVSGRRHWALFDSGARNTYVTPQAAEGMAVRDLPEQQTTGLGGKRHQIHQACLLFAEVDGHRVQTNANVVDEIGMDENGRQIDVFLGALAMQQWGISLDLQHEELYFRHYTPDFVEFSDL